MAAANTQGFDYVTKTELPAAQQGKVATGGFDYFTKTELPNAAGLTDPASLSAGGGSLTPMRGILGPL